MSERTQGDDRTPASDDEQKGQRIPGRDFAGASYASTEREQTGDHRGESHKHRGDDAENVDGDEQNAPRDES